MGSGSGVTVVGAGAMGSALVRALLPPHRESVIRTSLP